MKKLWLGILLALAGGCGNPATTTLGMTRSDPPHGGPQKAPIVMRQLELLVGRDSLRDGLREYLRGHAYANASWSELIALLDGRTPEDLAAWSRAWVDEPGRPTITSDVKIDAGLVTSLAVSQSDPRGRSP